MIPCPELCCWLLGMTCPFVGLMLHQWPNNLTAHHSGAQEPRSGVRGERSERLWIEAVIRVFHDRHTQGGETGTLFRLLRSDVRMFAVTSLMLEPAVSSFPAARQGVPPRKRDGPFFFFIALSVSKKGTLSSTLSSQNAGNGQKWART